MKARKPVRIAGCLAAPIGIATRCFSRGWGPQKGQGAVWTDQLEVILTDGKSSRR